MPVCTHREGTTALCPTPDSDTTVHMLKCQIHDSSCVPMPWTPMPPLLHAWMHPRPWLWSCSTATHIMNHQCHCCSACASIPHSRSVATPHIYTCWILAPWLLYNRPSVTSTAYQLYPHPWCYHCFVLSHLPNSSFVIPLCMLRPRQWCDHNFMCTCVPELSPCTNMWPRYRHHYFSAHSCILDQHQHHV